MSEQGPKHPEMQPRLSVGGEVGSHVYTQSTQRAMKVYPIVEPELEMISFLNTLSTVCFSLAFGSFCVGVDKWIDYGLADAPALSVWINTKIVMGISFGITVVFGSLGIWMWKRRRSYFEKVKQESQLRPVE